jgi:hypothetical protein
MIDIVSLLHDHLKDHPSLSDLNDWNKVHGFISSKESGLSIGIEHERFNDINRDFDKCIAKVNLFIWITNQDQAAGEQKIRELAHTVRLILYQDDVRTLNGEVMDGYVRRIKYSTTEANYHIAKIYYEVEYEEYRFFSDDVRTIENIHNEFK